MSFSQKGHNVLTLCSGNVSVYPSSNLCRKNYTIILLNYVFQINIGCYGDNLTPFRVDPR
jgi:hypothetical protein